MASGYRAYLGVLVAAAIGAAILIACGERPLADGPVQGPLPVYPHDDIPSAIVEGVVMVDEERRCVGLESGGRFYGALWPPGFELRANPYRIVDGAGRVVAHEGERIEGGGGEVPPGRFENPCGTSTLLLVGELAR